MSKKHFEALAAALKAMQPHLTEELIYQWELDCDAVADVCARFNPNFDRARFLTACGVEEPKS